MSVSRAAAKLPLGDSRRRQGMYPVPTALTRALLLADLAMGARRPVDQAVLQPLEWFGRNHPSARLDAATAAAQLIAPGACLHALRTHNLAEAPA